jgi:hypothetical protein
VAANHEVLAGLCGGVSLRDSLLAQLEAMEADEGDPDALARLYELDHVAARLRRNAENLRVLAGHDAGSAADAASPLVDVIRAAMSSIEQYPRIEIGSVTPQAVVGFAVDDLSRLLAELLDNATSHSPPMSKVAVTAHLTEPGGVLLHIEDAGIGPSGALGAVVLVDPRRVEDAFATITYFERSAVPFIAAVNMFEGEVVHELDELREALALGPDVPLTTCDARDPESAAQTLRELVSYTMNIGGSNHISPPEVPA